MPFHIVLSISFLLCCPSSPFFFITSLHQEVSRSPNTPLGFCRFSYVSKFNRFPKPQDPLLLSNPLPIKSLFLYFFLPSYKEPATFTWHFLKKQCFWDLIIILNSFYNFFWSSWSYCKYSVNPLLQHVSGRDSTTSPYFHLHRFPLNKFPNALGNISIFLASLQDNCTYDDRCNFSNLDMKELLSEFHICLLDIQNSKFYLIRQHRTITSQTQDWSFFKIYFLWTCSSISCPYN